MYIDTSVLICTYNCQDYIENTLKSVLKQTYKNFEILICDNNSTDEYTKYVLKKYQREYPDKIKVYYQKNNLGAYGGLNFLLDKTDKKYIAIQDHDDIWHRKKLKTQIDFLNKYEDFVGCGTEMVIYYELFKRFTYDLKFKLLDTKVPHASLVFRNSKKYRYNTKIKMYGDHYFMQKVLCKDKPMLYNIPKYYLIHTYKKKGDNLSLIWESKISYNEYKKINLILNSYYKSKFKYYYEKFVPFNLRAYISYKIIRPGKYIKNQNLIDQYSIK